MSMRRKLTLLALLSLVPFAFPITALADASQTPGLALEMRAPVPGAQLQPLQACPQTLDERLNLAETSQTDCCKGHKGICGCRAGRIVCCDSTASPNCTCHGEDGLIQ